MLGSSPGNGQPRPRSASRSFSSLVQSPDQTEPRLYAPSAHATRSDYGAGRDGHRRTAVARSCLARAGRAGQLSV